MTHSGAVCLVGGGGLLGTALLSAFSAKGYKLLTAGRTLENCYKSCGTLLSLARHTLPSLPLLLKDVQLQVVIDLARNSVPNATVDSVEDIARNLANAAPTSTSQAHPARFAPKPRFSAIAWRTAHLLRSM